MGAAVSLDAELADELDAEACEDDADALADDAADDDACELPAELAQPANSTQDKDAANATANIFFNIVPHKPRITNLCKTRAAAEYGRHATKAYSFSAAATWAT